MGYAHVTPEDATNIHVDVKSKKSVAVHWGTYALAYEVFFMFINLNFVFDYLIILFY
jgi:hypothetical protein